VDICKGLLNKRKEHLEIKVLTRCATNQAGYLQNWIVLPQLKFITR
jgi:hypothetical protein